MGAMRTARTRNPVARLLFAVAASSTVLAAGCGGGGSGASNPPPPVRYAVGVTLSGSGSGTVTSSPAGLSCGAGCSASFDAGTVVTLTAAPAAGSVFSGFSGDCTGTSCTLTVAAARSVTATFTRLRTLTVAAAGSGAGTITSATTPALACDAAAGAVTGTCAVQLPDGTPVALTAAPAAGSRFDAYSGACTGAACSFTLSADATVTAGFVAQYDVSVTFAGSGTGTVDLGTGTACTSSCTRTFDAGTALSIAGTADSGSRFAGFAGDYTGAGPDVIPSLGAAHSLTATFVAQVPVSVNFAGPGTGTVSFAGAAAACTASCTRLFDQGASVSVAGAADASSAFAGFSGDCTGATCSFPALAAPAKSVTATFTGIHSVGGTVTGLSGPGLVLGNAVNGGAAEPLAVSSNGSFAFPTLAPDGATWTVTVVTQPGSPAQACAVVAGTGSGTATADVTGVRIDCAPFVVAGGLDGPYNLALNGSTLYFGVNVYPGVTSCYTANPGAGDRVLMVPVSGGTPALVDDLDNFAGNCGLYGLVFDSTYVYWANYSTGNIKKFPLAGGSASAVVGVGAYANALALAGGELFFHTYPNAWIGRVTTAGTGSGQFASTASVNGQNLATDAAFLYWTDYTAGTVDKVALGASPLPAAPTVIASGETTPLAPYVTATDIYWIQPGEPGAVRHASLASPAAATLGTATIPNPVGVVVDGSSAWVLAQGTSANNWADGAVYRIPLAGGAPLAVAQGLHQPTSIAMDAGHVYWTENNTTTGGTRNSDGTIRMIVK